MGERSPTDVLAFPLHEWSLDGHHSHLADDDGISPPGTTLLGDVVIDLDQANPDSAERLDYQVEVCRGQTAITRNEALRPDEDATKRAFWTAFRSLGEWYAALPPY